MSQQGGLSGRYFAGVPLALHVAARRTSAVNVRRATLECLLPWREDNRKKKVQIFQIIESY